MAIRASANAIALLSLSEKHTGNLPNCHQVLKNFLHIEFEKCDIICLFKQTIIAVICFT